MASFEESKSLFASKTFWGVVFALLGIVGAPEYVLKGVSADALAGIADTVFEAVGLLLALIGRVKAEKKVHVIGPQ